MKKIDYTKLTKKELEKEIEVKRKELYDAKFDVRTGEKKNYKELMFMKKSIARMLTVLNEGTYAAKSSKKSKKKGKKTDKKETKKTKKSKKKEKDKK